MAVSVLPSSDDPEGDVSYNTDGTIVEGNDLKTAVFLSLFLDAPALPGDDVPDHGTRRGFWADAYSPDRDITGSRLWLLSRSKVTAGSIVDAKTYAEEALAWMVRDGVARSVVVTSERLIHSVETQGILINVVIYRPTGERYAFAWDALTAEEA